MAEAAVNAPANLYSLLSEAPARVQRLLLSGEESSRAINGQVGPEVSTTNRSRPRCTGSSNGESLRRLGAALFFT
eukprot:7214085-Prymnesium_polylepis.1